MSAAHGATTPIRAAAVTCRRPSTRIRLSRTRIWSKMWSSQPEIQAYLRRITDKYDLRRKTLFGAEVVEAHWDAAASRWRLRSADGRTITAQFLVMGIGPMTVPKIPDLKGIESFTGPAFHSARWDHSVDLTGKKVAVIGTGASAIQFVPIIAEQVGQLQLYQRTPPWVLSPAQPDHPQVTSDAFRQGAIDPQHLPRHRPTGSRRRRPSRCTGTGSCTSRWNGPAKANIRKSIKDPALVAKLTPDYQIGCKRLLYSPTYYPALGAAQCRGRSRTVSQRCDPGAS